MKGSNFVLDLLTRAARGAFPPPDGTVEVIGPPPGRADAVLAFTAHHVIAADVDPVEVRSRLPHDDLGAPLRAPFLAWLAGALKADAGMLDALMVAPNTPGGRPALTLLERERSEHPRIRWALAHREDVRTFTDAQDRGVMTIGRGLAGRREVSIEIDEAHRGAGLGRAMARAARDMVPGDEPLFAQVSPGNAASLRAFLAAGYQPIGAEVLFLKARSSISTIP
jgi:RimJ/RimL family protein N-acetyltransferase